MCQCYDGASVMSGGKGGIQAILQKHYKKVIPYIHCFNHRLHLVVADVVKKMDECQIFFDEVRLIHSFFNRFKVRQVYEGTNIPQLIEQRWSGHFRAIQAIKKNYVQLVETVTNIKNRSTRKFDAEDIALATGIAHSMTKRKFIFMLQFLCEFLALIEPANQILQKREIGFRIAMPIIETVFEKIRLLRSDNSFNKFLKATDEIIESHECESREKRSHQRSNRLNDSIVMCTLGDRHVDSECEISPEELLLKSICFEVIDRALTEIESRFHENSEILTAICEVNNILSDDFDQNSLLPLTELGLKLPSEAEMIVAKGYMSKEKAKSEKKDFSFLKLLKPVKDAVETTYNLFEAIETVGSSTSTNESSFSAYARIDRVQRMSMTDQRRGNLAFLAFEKQRLSCINNDEFLETFAKKNRRIQLI